MRDIIQRYNDNTGIIKAFNELLLSIDPNAQTLDEKRYNDNTDVIKAICLLGLLGLGGGGGGGGGDTFSLSNGSGTTANGSAVDLGGTLSAETIIDGILKIVANDNDNESFIATGNNGNPFVQLSSNKLDFSKGASLSFENSVGSLISYLGANASSMSLKDGKLGFGSTLNLGVDYIDESSYEDMDFENVEHIRKIPPIDKTKEWVINRLKTYTLREFNSSTGTVSFNVGESRTNWIRSLSPVLGTTNEILIKTENSDPESSVLVISGGLARAKYRFSIRLFYKIRSSVFGTKHTIKLGSPLFGGVNKAEHSRYTSPSWSAFNDGFSFEITFIQDLTNLSGDFEIPIELKNESFNPVSFKASSIEIDMTRLT